MTATSGTWDPADRPCYFIVGPGPDIIDAVVPAVLHVLIAVNVAARPEFAPFMESLLDRGVRVLLDSGVYSLAAEHARRHGLELPVALSLAPESVDGWGQLWDDYLRLARTWGDRVWGTIELDQGGAANKRKTRARLEDLGLAPIPVYHPLSDGWDYFDELGENYDRICLGNIVQADSQLRLALLWTVEERRRAYPGLWVHLLGLTPSPWCHAFSVDSADSSTWLAPARWGDYTERAMLDPLADLGPRYRSQRDVARSERGSWMDSVQMAGLGAAAMQAGWRHWLARLDEAGVQPGRRPA